MTFNAQRIIVGTHEAVGNMCVAAIVEVYSIGIVTPATDGLAVSDGNITASKAGDVVNQGVTYSDALDLDVAGIHKVNRVLAAAVAHIDSSVSEFFDREESQ